SSSIRIREVHDLGSSGSRTVQGSTPTSCLSSKVAVLVAYSPHTGIYVRSGWGDCATASLGASRTSVGALTIPPQAFSLIRAGRPWAEMALAEAPPSGTRRRGEAGEGCCSWFGSRRCTSPSAESFFAPWPAGG